MPTVHLSIPESLYERMRRKSEELGIQVTDLIKIYIKQGLEERDEAKEKSNDVLEENVLMLEVRMRQLEAIVNEIVERMREYEDREAEDIHTELVDRNT